MIPNPIMLIVGAYKFFAAMPMFWKVMRNYGAIKEIISEASQVLKVSAERGHPSCEETQKLFAIARKALKTGIIDIPGVDENQLAVALYDLENNLICSVNRGEKMHKGEWADEKSIPV